MAGRLKILLSQQKQTIGQQGSQRISALISTRQLKLRLDIRMNRSENCSKTNLSLPRAFKLGTSEEKSTSFSILAIFQQLLYPFEFWWWRDFRSGARQYHGPRMKIGVGKKA